MDLSIDLIVDWALFFQAFGAGKGEAPKGAVPGQGAERRKAIFLPGPAASLAPQLQHSVFSDSLWHPQVKTDNGIFKKGGEQQIPEELFASPINKKKDFFWAV